MHRYHQVISLFLHGNEYVFSTNAWMKVNTKIARIVGDILLSAACFIGPKGESYTIPRGNLINMFIFNAHVISLNLVWFQSTRFLMTMSTTN